MLDDRKLQNSDSVLTYEKWNGLIKDISDQFNLTIPGVKGEVTEGLVISGSGLTVSGEVGNVKKSPPVALLVNGNMHGGALKIQTEHGSLEIGPKSTGWAHFATDRPRFYFNKEIAVDSGKIGSYTENLQLCVGRSSKVTIQSNGYVGVGITTPKQKLHVNGGALRIQSTHGYVDVEAKSKDWCSFQTDRPSIFFNREIRVLSGKIGSHEENLQLCVESSSKVTIQSNGYVGIGVNNPTEKLLVNGNVKCNVVKGRSNTGEAKLLTKRLIDDRSQIANHEVSFGFTVRNIPKKHNKRYYGTQGYFVTYLDSKELTRISVPRGTKLTQNRGYRPPYGGEG